MLSLRLRHSKCTMTLSAARSQAPCTPDCPHPTCLTSESCRALPGRATTAVQACQAGSTCAGAQEGVGHVQGGKKMLYGAFIMQTWPQGAEV